MHPPRPRLTRDQEAAVMTALGGSLTKWNKDCHNASLRIVCEKVFPEARVARGWAEGVTSQHSWVVVGRSCYDPHTMIVDPTLRSYRTDVKGLWVGTIEDGIHKPHGYGSIWEWGKPRPANGPVVKLRNKWPLSKAAKDFLEMLGPLDLTGWHALANQAPVGGWPAGEIYSAMEDTKALSVIVPIDRIGMLTDRNPSGLFLADA